MSDPTAVAAPAPATVLKPSAEALATSAEDIAANPEKWGFQWRYTDLEKKGQTVSDAPQFEITPEMWDTFKHHFPNVAHASLTTSLRVTGQEPARNLKLSGMKNDAVKVELVRRCLFSIRAKSSGGGTKIVQQYIAVDGSVHDTPEAARRVKLPPALPTPVERAAQLMAALAEVGITGKEARARVMKAVPEAFAQDDKVTSNA